MKFEKLYSSSKGNCFLLSDDKTKIMIECGGSGKKMGKAINHKYYDINGVIVSHHHEDHCANVISLLKSGISCYMTEKTKEKCGAEGFMDAHVLKNEEIFAIGSFIIKPMLVDHFDSDLTPCECYAFYIVSITEKKSILFAIDLHFMPFKLPVGLDILAIECNYIEAKEGVLEEDVERRRAISHLSLESLLDVFDSNDTSSIKEIYLLHLSQTRSEEDEMYKKVVRATGSMVYV